MHMNKSLCTTQSVQEASITIAYSRFVQTYSTIKPAMTLMFADDTKCTRRTRYIKLVQQNTSNRTSTPVLFLAQHPFDLDKIVFLRFFVTSNLISVTYFQPYPDNLPSR